VKCDFVGRLLGKARGGLIPKRSLPLKTVLGFFAYFRDNICNYAALSKVLTDLTGKHVPFKIPWEEIRQKAFDQLKIAFCEAATKRLYIIDQSKLYHLSVDCSDYTVGRILSQIGDDDVDRSIGYRLHESEADRNPT
jgi:hypothetical protein